jgi:AAA domain (dynein-related subfamily)
MSSKNTPTDINQAESSSWKFAIDLLPIQNKEDKFSYISNLSILNWCTYSELKNLTLNTDSSTTDLVIKKEECKFFVDNLNSIWITVNDYMSGSRYISVGKVKNAWVLFFKAEEINIKGRKIIIKSRDWVKFMGDFETYLSKWIKALTRKNEWEISAIINDEKQKQKYHLEDGGLLNIRSKQLLNIGADDYCITNDVNNEFCVLKDNKIATYTYDDDSIDRQSDYFDLSTYGTIKNIRTDVNNNFYFIICEKEWISDLKILNRKTLEEVMSFSDLIEIVYLSNETGKLFCMDKDGYLRIVTINTKNLERWYIDNHNITAETTATNIIKIEDKPRSDLKNILSTGWISLTNTTNQLLDESDNGDDILLREELWKTVVDGMDWETLKTLYEKAENTKDMDTVYSIASQLKKNPHIMAVKGLIDPIITAIMQKRDKIRLADIDKELKQIVEDLAKTEDFSNLLQIKSQLQGFKTIRSQILTVDKDFDILFKDTLQAIDSKIQEYQNEHKEELGNDIEKNLVQITEYMNGIDYLPQITSIYVTDLRKQTEFMIWYLENDDRKIFKKKMQDIVTSRQQELTKQFKAWEKSEQQAQEETINEIKNNLTSLKWILDTISDEDTLKSIETWDPLVLSIRSQMNQISESKSYELSHQLDQMFKERLLNIQYSKESTVSWIKSLDQYWVPKSLYFVPDLIKKVSWTISWKKLNNWNIKLQFISSAGNIIEPSINKKILWNYKFEYTFHEWLELKKSITERKNNDTKKHESELLQDKEKNKEEIQKFEEKYYVAKMLETMTQMSNNGLWKVNPRPNLPHLDAKVTITPTVQKSLARRWRKLAQQLETKKWGLSITSDKGTWKNFKTEILWFLTNREIFELSCNQAMEKEDLLFSPEIDSDGTHRKPSKLIQWLQTPWSIIVLDEINTLRPDVWSLLNPLLDHRRHVNDPQVWVIKAHPSVLIVTLMNPLNYLWTKPLNQALDDRLVPETDEYMSAPEESFMISKFLEWPVSTLSESEFNSYRDEYISRNQQPNDKSIYNIFVALDKVTKLAGKMRDSYKKTMENNADISEELSFVVSPRSLIYIIQDYNYTKDIKQSVEDIILKKVIDQEQKEFVQKIIDDCC